MSDILDENESCFKKFREKSKFILLFSLKSDLIWGRGRVGGGQGGGRGEGSCWGGSGWM